MGPVEKTDLQSSLPSKVVEEVLKTNLSMPENQENDSPLNDHKKRYAAITSEDSTLLYNVMPFDKSKTLGKRFESNPGEYGYYMRTKDENDNQIIFIGQYVITNYNKTQYEFNDGSNENRKVALNDISQVFYISVEKVEKATIGGKRRRKTRKSKKTRKSRSRRHRKTKR